MDNLQRFYLAQLEAAEEHGLHGNTNSCLDICWDLRLEPDLAIYTRALVNSAIARYTTPEEHPDKMKFAEEIGRLAQYLYETEGENEKILWLQDHAKEVVAMVTAQMTEYNAQEAEREEEEENIQELPEGIKTIIIPRKDDGRPVIPWSVEDMYRPVGTKAGEVSGSETGTQSLPETRGSKDSENVQIPHESVEGASDPLSPSISLGHGSTREANVELPIMTKDA